MTLTALIDRIVVARNIRDGHTSVDHRRLIDVFCGVLTVLATLGSYFNANLCSSICLLTGIVIF